MTRIENNGFRNHSLHLRDTCPLSPSAALRSALALTAIPLLQTVRPALDDGVFSIHSVAVLTVALVSTGLALLVDLLGHGLKVRRVAAAREPAEVVYLQSLGDATYKSGVHDAVGK